MMKSTKIILLIALALLISLFAVSCGDTATESISVSETDSFQTVYVLGGELNLSGGVIKAVSGGKTTDIPLDSEGVSVTGYDENKLGKQTLTVTYDGVSTEITVTVVERVVVNNAITDYLIGDSFDATRGNIKITSDDGKSHTVSLSDKSVTISGFDSANPVTGLDVKVTCADDGTTVEGSFKVNIFAVETVELRKPNKITYGSHYEGKPDVAGGYFVLKGNGGEIRREVGLTPDMVTGLDVSIVSAEKPTDTQILTVTYDKKTYTYEVQITYTDVSLFRDNKAAFDTVLWDGAAEPVIEQTLGELAISLMTAYGDMNDADKALIDSDYVYDVARTAMMYGFEVWGESIRLFRDAFAIEYGEKVLYLKSYDAVKGVLGLFDDEDSAIYTVAPLLLSLIDTYGDSVIYENETTRIMFSSYPVMDRYALTVMEAMLEHAIDVYDTLSAVPDGWSIDGISEYSQDIEKTISKIIGKTYVTEYPEIYYLISKWRTGDDLFDILYSYLYKTEKTTVIPVLAAYGLPGELHELYEYIRGGVIVMDSLQRFQIKDSSAFFYNYYLALEVAGVVERETESVDYYLYKNVAINKLLGINTAEHISFELMLEYLRTVSCGYYDLSSGLVGVDAFDVLMREYAILIKNTVEDEDFVSTDTYADAVKSLFDKFVSLSPTQQYNLISTLHSLYALGTPELAFDDVNNGEDDCSLFVVIINNFMRSKLSQEHSETYNNLILAIEIYANRLGRENWESEFVEKMDKVSAAVGTLEGTDKDNFERYLLTAYNKYDAIKKNLNTTTNLGEWADEFETLKAALTNAQTAYYYMTSSGSRNYNYFLASFERASDIADNILKNAPVSVIAAYNGEALFEAYPENTETGEEAIYWTLEYAVNAYRNLYIKSLAFFGETAVNVYETYIDNGLDEFLSLYYDMVNAFVNKAEAEGSVFDVNSTLAVITAFKNLDSPTKALFIIMEYEVDMYYNALNLFISEAFTEEAAEVATKLVGLENDFFNYEIAASDITLGAIKTHLPEIKELYSELDGEDKESFKPLEEIYSYYVLACEKVLG